MEGCYDFMFKLLIVGESGVGKTCMLLQYADSVFEENFLSTIGVDFKVKLIDVDDKKVKLQIWDSAGQDRFRNITASYYRNSSGMIIVYDVTNHSTFDKISDWVEEVRRFAPDVPLLLVGNKCDLDDKRQVTFEEGKELSEKLHTFFFETSAKTAYNINKIFDELSRELIVDLQKKPKQESTKQVNLLETSKKPKKCCIIE